MADVGAGQYACIQHTIREFPCLSDREPAMRRHSELSTVAVPILLGRYMRYWNPPLPTWKASSALS